MSGRATVFVDEAAEEVNRFDAADVCRRGDRDGRGYRSTWRTWCECVTV
jgi:hypothetical protein